MQESQPTFHLGLTMAGAVSAGCYSAGVLDYLFEVFDLWENARKGLIPELQEFVDIIPQHRVVIDAIGGASAGGMTASMAVIHALSQRKSVSEPGVVMEKKGNIFYDSWVLLDDPIDGKGPKTFGKMLEIDDLDNGKIESLLNSKVIDNIARRAFDISGSLDIDGLPAYISKELEMMLSVAMLRGLPLEVDFRTPIRERTKRRKDSPAHITWEHYTLGHFKFSNAQKAGYLWLNPFDQKARELMLKCTIATGAFPIGLKFRKFEVSDFPNEYLKTVAERIIFNRFGTDEFAEEAEKVRETLRSTIPLGSLNPRTASKFEELIKDLPESLRDFRDLLKEKFPEDYIKYEVPLEDWPDFIDWNKLKPDFDFMAIDGGTINNEPFGEVLKSLMNKFGHLGQGKDKMYGVVMVDPFPDRMDKEQSEQDDQYQHPLDIFDAAGKIIGTLKNQSRVKRHEMALESDDDFIKGVVFPKKWERIDANNSERVRNIKWPLTCESFNAFGGFLDIRFRQHDYFLGRDNARNFIRHFFSLPAAEGQRHPIHRNWTVEMISKFGIQKDHEPLFLPIIPDLNILLEEKRGIESDPYRYSVPVRPRYNGNELLGYRKQMEKRVERLIKLAEIKLNADGRGSANESSPKADKMIAQSYNIPILLRPFSSLKKWLIQLLLKRVPGSLSNMATKGALHYILKDLEEKDLLE